MLDLSILNIFAIWFGNTPPHEPYTRTIVEICSSISSLFHSIYRCLMSLKLSAIFLANTLSNESTSFFDFKTQLLVGCLHNDRIYFLCFYLKPWITVKYDLTERYSKRVVHTFLSGKVSATLIIPLNTARKYGLDKPSDVIVEETQR